MTKKPDAIFVRGFADRKRQSEHLGLATLFKARLKRSQYGSPNNTIHPFPFDLG